MSNPINAPEVFRLSNADKSGDTWAKLRRHLVERQGYLRAQLEGDQDERATARTRGMLAEIRRLLDLEKDQPNLPPQ